MDSLRQLDLQIDLQRLAPRDPILNSCCLSSPRTNVTDRV